MTVFIVSSGANQRMRSGIGALVTLCRLMILWIVILAGPATTQLTPNLVNTAPNNSSSSLPAAPSNNQTSSTNQVAYAVRWLNPSLKAFGATLNISLTADMLNTQDWIMGFTFASNDVDINDYWGSWDMKRYEKPSFELTSKGAPVDDSGKLYFSFNGVYQTTSASDAFSGLYLNSVTLQPNQSAAKIQLSDAASGLINTPIIAAKLPTTPFDKFDRGDTHSSNDVTGDSSNANSNAGQLGSAPMIGFYITLGLLILFILILGAATIGRAWFRHQYRKLIKIREEERKIGLLIPPMSESNPYLPKAADQSFTQDNGVPGMQEVPLSPLIPPTEMTGHPGARYSALPYRSSAHQFAMVVPAERPTVAKRSEKQPRHTVMTPTYHQQPSDQHLVPTPNPLNASFLGSATILQLSPDFNPELLVNDYSGDPSSACYVTNNTPHYVYEGKR